MKLTYAQSGLLRKVPDDWTEMHAVGCTNRTLAALEKLGLVEARIKKFIPMGFSVWEWRKKPTGEAA